MLYYKYALWLGCFSTIGTLVGLSLIQRAVNYFKKASIVIFLLFGVLILAAGITVVEDSRKILAMSDPWMTHSICY